DVDERAAGAGAAVVHHARNQALSGPRLAEQEDRRGAAAAGGVEGGEVANLLPERAHAARVPENPARGVAARQGANEPPLAVGVQVSVLALGFAGFRPARWLRC